MAGSLEDALAQLKEATEALADRRALREANLEPQRPGDGVLKKLDSSMKRNTTLIRKLKALTEDTAKSVLDDIAKTNQSKYVSEAVAAVAEAPIKLKDVGAAVRIASALHQRYAEFSGELISALSRAFGPLKGAAPAAAAAAGGGGEDRPTPARRRITLRLLVELLLEGVFTAHTALLSIVKTLASSGAADLSRNREEALVALSLMTALAKAGREEVLGLPHAAPAALPDDLAARAADGDASAAAAVAAADAYSAELAQRWALAPEAQAQFRAAAEKLLDASIETLRALHAAVAKRKRDNERVINTRGDLPESLAAKYDALCTEFEALERAAGSLAEALERKLPELAVVAREDEGLDAEEGSGPAPAIPGANSPFEDEETRVLYESLPNLRESVPAVLLKGAVPEAEAAAAAAAAEAEAEAEAEVPEVESAEVVEAIPAGEEEKPEEHEETPEEAAAERAGEQAADIEAEMAALEIGDDGDVDIPEISVPVDFGAGGEGEASKEGGGGRSGLSAMLERLPACVSKELADEAAAEFCYAGGAAKAARKRLAAALCSPPPGALQLLPYYARVAAVLAPLFPDVAATVAKYLEGECRGLTRRKDATMRTLEPRLRNARYIGEMVKFRTFPAGTAFRLLKGLLDDFSGHNIDAACALVESAGRYLLRRADTAQRMTTWLDIMMRLKAAKNMDARQASLIDSTFHVVKSSATAVRKVKERPPTHEWVRYLIYTRLEPGSVPHVLKKLRRLDWTADGRYILATLLRAARKGRYSQLAPIAQLTAGLARYHPWLGVSIVDAVLEDIAAGLEAPDAALYQRRVAAVRLLGELYAYKMANSGVVFGTLHALLAPPAPGISTEEARRLDPPQNFFRVRLVCALLESCGSYFARGAARKRLDDFLPYLARYVLAKPPMPLDVDLDLQELYNRLKISPPEYESYEAACAAVAEVEARAAAAAAAGLEAIQEEEEEEEEEAEDEEEESDGEEAGAGEAEGSEDSGSEGSSGSDGDSESSDEESDEEDEEDDEDMGREKTEAEEEFERELAAALGEGPSTGGAVVAPGPMPAKPPVAAAAAPKETLALRVMVRRGSRSDRSAEVMIPVPTAAAQRLREKEAAEAAERAEVKRMVLAANRRDEIETLQAAVTGATTMRRGQHWRGHGGGGGRGGGGEGSSSHHRH